jgi:hypothetical protein
VVLLPIKEPSVSRFRLSAFALVLLAFVAACTSDAGPDADATPTAEATPEATPEPTLAEGAGDLAAILPTEVGGMTIEYQSASGAAVLGSEGASPETQALFARLGADPSDLSSAFGFAFDAESQTGVSIFAFRVEGADEGQLRNEFRTVMEDQGATVTEETVGGKSVIHAGYEGATQGYIYVKGDIAFVVSGEPVALAEEALAALP